MDVPYSVNSPRRVLSLSRRRKGSPLFSELHEKGQGFGSSIEHGPKPSEVYGFVGAITTVVATVIVLIWAYVPDTWLHSVGISYYPSRYWALAVPTYAMVAIALTIVFYIGLNFMVTPPPTSFNTIFVLQMSIAGNLQALIIQLRVISSQLSQYLISDSIISMISCSTLANRESTFDDLRFDPNISSLM